MIGGFSDISFDEHPFPQNKRTKDQKVLVRKGELNVKDEKSNW